MKKKNLERAVLLTVMLMALHNGAGAVELGYIEIEGSIIPERTFTTSSSELTTAIWLVSGNNADITFDGNGNIEFTGHEDRLTIYLNGGSQLNFENIGDVTIHKNYVGSPNSLRQSSAVEVFGGTLRVSDNTNFYVIADSDLSSEPNRSVKALSATFLGEIDIGKKGATVTLNGQSGDSTTFIGVECSERSTFSSDGKLKIDVNTKNDYWDGTNNTNYGLYNQDGHFQATMNLTDVDITVTGNVANSYGMSIEQADTEVNITGKTNITVSGSHSLAYGIYDTGNLTLNDVEINSTSNGEAYGIYSDAAGDVTVNGDARINTGNIAAYADGSEAVIDFEKGFYAAAANEILQAANGGKINVNSTSNGTVQYKGITNMDNNSSINMNLTNADSYWNMTGDSTLTALTHANNALLDMTQDNNALSTLTVGTLDGSGGIIYMDVDEKSNLNNSDRLYITGTHTGEHQIAVIPKGGVVDINDVVGTVLASVNDEQGSFTARKEEGALYWENYELTEQEHTETTDYKTDWVISAVNIVPDESTTTVDAIMGANALNFHAWRGENGQLMRRMGELRLNGDDVEGAWFRMHGSKMSRNDNAAFENKYTSYELGYDQLTKNTDSVKRYTGAALSYTDGSSTYGSGSGENHSKAISFYNTDIYKSGHYLDLVFKYAQFDNDFDVFDTHGHEISGEYKNTGISVSAEYGRKNNLKEGWFIEPQAQLTLGYFAGDEYETSNGIKVDQSGIPSVLGRIGMSIGKEFNDNGVIYAKASLLHEFAGDYDITMSNTYSGGISRKESASFGDTWVEYGIGAAFKTGKNNYFHFDLARATGADFDRDWMWNAGMRWTF